MQSSQSSRKRYKVKLTSGRILGPLDLERVRLLILKRHITGVEQAREDPVGEWQDINRIPELAELIIGYAEGRISKSPTPTQTGAESGSTQLLPGTDSSIPSGLLPGSEPLVAVSLPELQVVDQSAVPSELPQEPVFEIEDQELTTVEVHEEAKSEESEEEAQTTVQESEPESIELDYGDHAGPPSDTFEEKRRGVGEAKTVIFQRSGAGAKANGKRKNRMRDWMRASFIAIGLGILGYESFFEPPKKEGFDLKPVRPTLPQLSQSKPDPARSSQLYGEAMKSYVQDTVAGYKDAASKLRAAVALDPGNVKALAMLASSYLDLIDSSNKDENYFAVISKLIELSRARDVDLSETVIADVEFYLMANKPEAAQNRVVEYTKTHQNFPLEMFYYLSLAFYHRGDVASASRYLGQIPDNKVFSAKVFYLRGQIAEASKESELALTEYQKAIKLNPLHAKSHLRTSYLLREKGQLRESAPHLQFLVSRPDLLAPKERARAYYLNSLLIQLSEKWDLALADAERAVQLDPGNSNYLLEMYTIRARLGDKVDKFRGDARMFYFLSQGEKSIQEGKMQEALAQFLQARQANDRSPLPLVKIGDMFARTYDLSNARINYKLATERAPQNIQIWSKYIDTLIQSYELKEAEKAMEKFRNLPVSQSAIDKAAADIYAKQNRFAEAQTFYRKAMTRELIDSDVYVAYAKSLMATNNFKEAPFFFALALRFDPLNAEAIIGTAKCVAATESIDRAISQLQDELQKGPALRGELLAAIGEFHMQKGDLNQAQNYIEQAKSANPEYAYPWKLEAQIYMQEEGRIKNALDKALEAYQSFSERNRSDPSGYLERYRIFIKKAKYENAKEELEKIYGIYPRYPNLRYYWGKLFSAMGNYKAAVEEFKKEIENNSNHSAAILDLGRTYVTMGAVEDGLREFNKAMAMAPKSAEAKQEAAYANLLLKNYQAAIGLYQAALVYDKANPMIYKRMGMAYKEMGDTRNAASAFQKYLEMEPDAPDRHLFENFR